MWQCAVVAPCVPSRILGRRSVRPCSILRKSSRTLRRSRTVFSCTSTRPAGALSGCSMSGTPASTRTTTRTHAGQSRSATGPACVPSGARRTRAQSIRSVARLASAAPTRTVRRSSSTTRITSRRWSAGTSRARLAHASASAPSSISAQRSVSLRPTTSTTHSHSTPRPCLAIGSLNSSRRLSCPRRGQLFRTRSYILLARRGTRAPSRR
mmetsp:Transcript_10127/g.21421  ORF Transcript_10127/g.21421 Transcript_10127/m.21421 type:complete len:210 (-) Transcript_10127:355-984(-)